MKGPEGGVFLCARRDTFVLEAPSVDAQAVSQLLVGEVFEVKGSRGGYRFGSSVLDGYNGWVQTDCLVPVDGPPAYKVAVPRTFLYPKPDMKTRPVLTLHMGSRLRAINDLQEGSNGQFLFVRVGELLEGYVWCEHVVALDVRVKDYVALALGFCYAPYLWGGRGSGGIDCSGLVQLVLQMGGCYLPRDSREQVSEGCLHLFSYHNSVCANLRRGDLVFWPGHVGMMIDGERMVHASGAAMQVVSEPLAPFLAAQEEKGRPFLGVRRPLI